MSDAEKFEAQGRAQDALKRARSNAASIKVSLLEHAKTLEETGRLVRQFIDKPTYKNPSHIPLAEHLKAQFEVVSHLPILLIDELIKETATVSDLQNQVDQF
jgi:hypothetical protein